MKENHTAVPCECERATCDACHNSIDVEGLMRQIETQRKRGNNFKELLENSKKLMAFTEHKKDCKGFGLMCTCGLFEIEDAVCNIIEVEKDL